MYVYKLDRNFMINTRNITLFLLVFGMCAVGANAQIFTSYFVSGGLTGTDILGDNPGAQSFTPKVFKGTRVGGNFNVIQPGFDLRFAAQFAREEDNIDKNNTVLLPEKSIFGNKMRVAAGLNYIAYRAHEAEASAYKEYNKLVHSLDQYNLYLGFDWIPLELYWARTRVIIGAEMWNNFFVGNEMRFTRDNILNPSRDTAFTSSEKDDVYRIGGALKLGVEGDLRKGLQVTAGARLGALNLLLRDNKRRELLTPFNDFETEESIVGTISFYFSLQYKF